MGLFNHALIHTASKEGSKILLEKGEKNKEGAWAGAAGGVAVGFLLGGPIGAIFGGIAGAAQGVEIQDYMKKRKKT